MAYIFLIGLFVAFGLFSISKQSDYADFAPIQIRLKDGTTLPEPKQGSYFWHGCSISSFLQTNQYSCACMTTGRSHSFTIACYCDKDSSLCKSTGPDAVYIKEKSSDSNAMTPVEIRLKSGAFLSEISQENATGPTSACGQYASTLTGVNHSCICESMDRVNGFLFTCYCNETRTNFDAIFGCGTTSDKTLVACANLKLDDVNPDLQILKYENQTVVHVCGNWVKYQCASGTVKAFNISKTAYAYAINSCKTKGFQVAQPTNNVESISWTPFQIGNKFTDSYRKDKADTWTFASSTSIEGCQQKQKSPDTMGKKFFTTFPRDATGPGLNQLFLATDTQSVFPVNITFKQSIGVTYKTVVVSNASVASLDFPQESSHSFGLKISADYDFAAYTTHTSDHSADATQLLPIDALGTDYLVLSPQGGTGGHALVYVTTTSDETTVTVMFKNKTGRSYFLNENDVINLDFKQDDDASGTKISSDKSIAVVVGQQCNEMPLGCGLCGLVYDQLMPTNTHGLEYVLAPYPTSHSNQKPTCCINSTWCDDFYQFFKILAIHDMTTVARTITKDGRDLVKETLTLNAGDTEFLRPLQDEYSLLQSDKPIIVAHIMTGSEYIDTSNPTLLFLPAKDVAFTKNHFFASCNPNFYSHFITIIIETAKANDLLLNGQAILRNLQANRIPATSMSAFHYQLQCPSRKSAQFLISHPDPNILFSVTAYGFANHMAYAFTPARTIRISDFYL